MCAMCQYEALVGRTAGGWRPSCGARARGGARLHLRRVGRAQGAAAALLERAPPARGQHARVPGERGAAGGRPASGALGGRHTGPRPAPPIGRSPPRQR